MEEDQEEHLLSSVCQILICKIIYRSCVFLYMTWEERGGVMLVRDLPLESRIKQQNSSASKERELLHAF